MKFNSRVVAIVVSIAIAAFALSAFAGWRSAVDPLPASGLEPDWLLLIGLAVTAVGLFSRAASSSHGTPDQPRNCRAHGAI